jgi:hypothetical protein
MKKLIVFLAAVSAISCSTAKQQPELAQTPPPQKTAAQETTVSTSKMATDFVTKEVCESGTDKRTLEVQKKSDGCDLTYEKFGKEKTVASGKFGTKHCQTSLMKIIKKLTADNFSCQEISR